MNDGRHQFGGRHELAQRQKIMCLEIADHYRGPCFCLFINKIIIFILNSFLWVSLSRIVRRAFSSTKYFIKKKINIIHHDAIVGNIESGCFCHRRLSAGKYAKATTFLVFVFFINRMEYNMFFSFVGYGRWNRMFFFLLR